MIQILQKFSNFFMNPESVNILNNGDVLVQLTQIKDTLDRFENTSQMGSSVQF